jgi:hypothetical protein
VVFRPGAGAVVLAAGDELGFAAGFSPPLWAGSADAAMPKAAGGAHSADDTVAGSAAGGVGLGLPLF